MDGFIAQLIEHRIGKKVMSSIPVKAFSSFIHSMRLPGVFLSEFVFSELKVFFVVTKSLNLLLQTTHLNLIQGEQLCGEFKALNLQHGLHLGPGCYYTGCPSYGLK